MSFKKCTYCQEEIPVDMVRCPYCCSILKNDKQNSDKCVAEKDMQKRTAYSGNVKIKVNKPQKADEIDESTPQKQIVRNNKQKKCDKNCNLKMSWQIGNSQKVFITALTIAIPVIGQLVGIIYSIFTLCWAKNTDSQYFAGILLFTAISVFLLMCFLFMTVSWIFVAIFRHVLL